MNMSMSMGVRSNVQTPDFDAAKRARRKSQNRQNQRARRSRIREALDENGATKQPFRVRKWRLNEDEDQSLHDISSRELVSCRVHHSHGQTTKRSQATLRCAALTANSKSRLNPFADGLLHLIHENIYHALAYNKIIFHQNVEEVVSNDDKVDPARACLHLSLNLPLTEEMPANLFPTQIQQRVPHSNWINAIPFPQLRDNLIIWHDSFDHAEFLIDLVGFLMDLSDFRKPRQQKTPGSSGIESGAAVVGSEIEGDECDVTVRWRGAIIWGQPYLMESWEFTAQFLRKWAWTVEGCEDAIRVSNSWRKSRGIAPLRWKPHASKA